MLCLRWFEIAIESLNSNFKKEWEISINHTPNRWMGGDDGVIDIETDSVGNITATVLLSIDPAIQS